MCNSNLVSVIIPMYNAEKCIETCLKSIVHQTYSSLEILVVDDGSNDKSIAIAKELQGSDARIKLISNKSKGVSSARNMGINASSGKWIVFCDSDDWMENSLIEQLVKIAEENDLDYVGSGFSEDYYNGDILYQTKKYGVAQLIIGDQSSFPKDMSYAFRSRRTLLTTPWCKLFKKDLLFKHRVLFNEQSVYGEDFEFNLRVLLLIQRYGFLPIEQYHYNNQIGVGSVDKIAKKDIIFEMDSVFYSMKPLIEKYHHSDLESQFKDCIFDWYKLAIRKMMSEKDKKKRNLILNHLMSSEGFLTLSTYYSIFRILYKLYTLHMNGLTYMVIQHKLFNSR